MEKRIKMQDVELKSEFSQPSQERVNIKAN